jgi:hypothetical protein
VHGSRLSSIAVGARSTHCEGDAALLLLAMKSSWARVLTMPIKGAKAGARLYSWDDISDVFSAAERVSLMRGCLNDDLRWRSRARIA